VNDDRLSHPRHAGRVRLVLLQHVPRLEERLSNNGPRYEHAAKAAAEWLNLHDPSECKAQQFGRLLFLILSAIYAAEEEISGIRYEPSEN
jgi:hypothetical protein